MWSACERERARIVFRVSLGHIEQREIGELARFEFEIGRLFEIGKPCRTVADQLSGFQERYAWSHCSTSSRVNLICTRRAAPASREPYFGHPNDKDAGRTSLFPGFLGAGPSTKTMASQKRRSCVAWRSTMAARTKATCEFRSGVSFARSRAPNRRFARKW